MERNQGDPLNDELIQTASTNKVKNICDLPNELLVTIFSNLPACDVLTCERVSKKFQVSWEPLEISRIRFSEMIRINGSVLFPPGEMFACIFRFMKFLDSERTRNLKYLDARGF